MKAVWASLLVTLALLATGPSGTASVADASNAAACAAPPCGYIVPQIILDFPDKPVCRAQTLGGPIDLSSCISLPAVGSTHVEEGVFRFSWDITQDGTYPADPLQPIVVTFGGTSTNPAWMDLQVEPSSVELDAVALVNPQNMRVDPDTQQVWFWYEVPVKVTFSRTAVGDDDKSTQRIERGQGAVQMFLKAKSGASGQYFKEAFGVEEFRFNSCANDDVLADAVQQCIGIVPANDPDAPAPGAASQNTPGLGLFGVVALLGVAALAARRRS